MTREDLAGRIFAASHLTGEFVLRSGATATEYFDKYRFEHQPGLLMAIARELAQLVPEGAEGVGGLELGGVPLATLVSQLTDLPLYSVRKRAKEYGTRRLAEGGEVAGVRIVVIEDVVTSGGQVVISSQELRSLGAKVDTAICVIDRQAGGTEALREVGIELRALFTMEELKRAGG